MAVTAPAVLPGNILTRADSDFESGAGTPTWTADVNASGVSASSSQALSGASSLTWTATTAADSGVATDYYPVTPSKGYTVSGHIRTNAGLRDTFIGVRWYTSANSLIQTDIGPVNSSPSAPMWQPVYAAVTSPPNAAKAKVYFLVQRVGTAGEMFNVDLIYFARGEVQVLADWVNPAFSDNSAAGADFSDLTPWVRLDQVISMSRGRQDSISEIQTGQATFQLQNDHGWFTPLNSRSLYAALGAQVGLGARCQISVTDENGNWNERFDGTVGELDYAFDSTGNTNICSVSASDIFAYLNRQDAMSCWTKETVLNSRPWLHWSLNDAGNAGTMSTAAETSGNNGPLLHPVTSWGASGASIQWQSSNGGVETLADAQIAGQNDQSQFWSPGAVSATASVRALQDATGAPVAGVSVGPYSTPMPSTYFTPQMTAQSFQNGFVGNTGFELVGELPTPITPNADGQDYTLESWFVMEPQISTKLSANLGPFTVLSLGSSRQASCLVAGLYLNAGALRFTVATYNQPPAFSGTSFGSAPIMTASIPVAFPVDTVPVPHHLVITIQGAATGATLTVYIDNNPSGSTITLPVGQQYDTISIGGAWGGRGCFWGNVSLVSIYQYALDPSVIQSHCGIGQYGFWERTTDECIEALAQFGDIPGWANNIGASVTGLTLTDYSDINGSNALSNMQTFEQAEHGLLFTDSDGLLNFHTRDWRMGYGAPDLLLPPDTYTADMSYELIDQFVTNEAAFSTPIFQTGVAWVNQVSQDALGVYSAGGGGASLPLITWSRAFSNLGLAPYLYYADPWLNDNAAWQVNTRGTPQLTCGALTIDLKTLDPTTGLHVSDFYALEIDNMVALTGTLPISMPDQPAALELFIEGINESISTTAHTIDFFTSPAAIQRAWKPGDATYGALGVTSRLGISDIDTAVPQSLGKSVSHDAGPPTWPPAFSPNYAGLTGDFETGTEGWTAATNCAVSQSTDYASTNVNSLKIVSSATGAFQAQSGFNTVPANTVFTVNIDCATISTAVNAAYIGVLFYDSSNTQIGSETDCVDTAYTAGAVNTLTLTVTAPSNAAKYRITAGDHSATDAASTTFYIDNIIVPPVSMNNPAINGHNFIGASEMRGLRDNLAQILEPPLLAVGVATHSQNFSSGNITSPNVTWDTVYVDTVNGMGVIPSWPNWYVVTVAGFYEMDGAGVWVAESSGTAGVRTAYLLVAQRAAQAVAAGTGDPTSVGAYVYPIGEEHQGNNLSLQPVCSPSARLYLGLGDMVTLCVTQNSGGIKSTSNMHGAGSIFSLRYCGMSVNDDQNIVDTSIGGAGSSGGGTKPPPVKTYTKTYTSTHTYSYWGYDGLRNVDGFAYQGEYQYGTDTGSQYTFIRFPSSIASDLTGATVTGVKLKGTNQHTWFGNGGYMMLGYSTRTTSLGNSTISFPATSDHPNAITSVFWRQGQTKTMSLPTSVGTWFKSNSATCILMGNGKTVDLNYYGFWSGGNHWTLTITYKK